MKKWLVRIALACFAGLLLFVGVAFLRLQMVKNEIRQEDQNLSASGRLSFGETKTVEILPLYEFASQDGLESGPGVSYLVRTDSATILFDLGYNLTAASPSPLEQNMARLGVSLDDIDLIVISHRHPDHVGGGNWWSKGTFSISGDTQPSLGDIPIYIPEAMHYPGSSPILAKNPTRLVEGVATTGFIPYAQPFPVWLAMPAGTEQSLAINISGKGILLVTGCGHMGLNALLERAKTAFNSPVIGVVGGLHYGNADAASLAPEIQLVRELNPLVVGLSPHDSGSKALDAFAQAFPTVYRPIRVGEAIRFP
jgi:7,8-dihydropterin-6-yl-methyl-4-(beta-D-ribofuranosyl)aminobenzene 5'-phosphate synthase